VFVHCILTIAVSKGSTLHQMDVHNTFLYGDLDEHIYMKTLPGFVPPSSKMVCKLKSLSMDFSKRHANGILGLLLLSKTMVLNNLLRITLYSVIIREKSFLLFLSMWMTGC